MIYTRIRLLKDYFEMSAGEAMRELKVLTDNDKNQLASAIARDRSIDSSQCDFPVVDY